MFDNIMVRLESVSFAIKGRPILRNVCLDICRGSRLVLLGPSGCGKTTLLRLIAGFDAPDTGTIFINNALASQDSKIIVPPEERDIGFVFQDLALWPHMSVYGHLEFVLRAKGFSRSKRERRISKLLKIMDLIGMEGRRPHELSGGQQQRVALARALVADPELVLMDEPLSSLDWDLRTRLATEICRLQEDLGFTLIYVTHDKDETRQLATQVVIMKAGTIYSKNDSCSI